jgi:hypothetical protein
MTIVFADVEPGASGAPERHDVEPDAGYCLVCRRRVARVGLREWRHQAPVH